MKILPFLVVHRWPKPRDNYRQALRACMGFAPATSGISHLLATLGHWRELPSRMTLQRAGLAALKTLWCIFASILISGCNATLPSAPTEALIPVATPCLTAADVPPRPELVSDKELLGMADAAFVFALAKDRLERQGYEGQLEAVIQACVTTAPAEAPTPAPVKPSADKPWWKIW
jgi:hypothetical protein